MYNKHSKYVPASHQALHAQQRRFGLRAGAESLGSQIENHETHTETLQNYQAVQRGSQPPCVTVLDLPIIKDIMIESPMLVPPLTDGSTI